jgi:hypothetical protein
MVYAFSHATIDPADAHKIVLSPNLGKVAVVAANLYVIFFNLSWGPGHVGHARRDVPQPDPRLVACGRRLLPMVRQLPGRTELPGHGGQLGA